MSEDNVIYMEPDAPEIEQQPEAVQFTEDAQGKAFVDNHDGNLRYVNENDQWYSHNGIYWEAINTLKVIEAADEPWNCHCT